MKILSRKVVYECPILKVEERQVLIEKQLNPSQKKSKKLKEAPKRIEKIFWVVVRPPNVTTIALTNDKKIVFIKERIKGKECLNLPGGKVEKYNASRAEIKHQALKELQEEAGYTAKNSELLGIEESPWNTLDRKFYHFLAWDLEDTGQDLEEGEIISRYLVSVQEAEKIIHDRKMTSPEEERILVKALEILRKQKLI